MNPVAQRSNFGLEDQHTSGRISGRVVHDRRVAIVNQEGVVYGAVGIGYAATCRCVREGALQVARVGRPDGLNASSVPAVVVDVTAHLDTLVEAGRRWIPGRCIDACSLILETAF